MVTITTDNYGIIFHRLPECEKDRCIYVWHGEAITWRMLFHMLFDDFRKATLIIKYVNRILG